MKVFDWRKAFVVALLSAGCVSALRAAPSAETQRAAVFLLKQGKWDEATSLLETQAIAQEPIEKQLLVVQQLLHFSFGFYNRRDWGRASETAALALRRFEPRLADRELTLLHFSVAREAAVAAELIAGDMELAERCVGMALVYTENVTQEGDLKGVRGELLQKQTRLKHKRKLANSK